VTAGNADIEFLVSLGVRDILVSYHYLEKPTPSGKWKGRIMNPEKIRRNYGEQLDGIFLDCGAFSSLQSGKEIDIDEYSDYFLEFQDFITTGVCLDPLWDQANLTRGTFDNYLYMLNKGCYKATPIWHGNERFWHVLEEYAKMTDYIAIGSAAKRKVKQRIFREFSGHRFHGFAQTDWYGMLRYPFYSADSSTWAKTPAFGFKVDPHIRKAGKKCGKGISDLLDSKVNPRVRNYKNRREAFVLDMLERLDKYVEPRFGQWKYVEPFRKDASPGFKIEPDPVGEDHSLKKHKNAFRSRRLAFQKKRYEDYEGEFKVEL